MAEANFRLPPNLDLSDTDGNLAEHFKRWKRQLEVYMTASGADTKSKARQTAIILHCAGPQVLEIYDHFEFNEVAEMNDPKIVLQKIADYCNPRQNEVLQTFRFWNISFHEPFDAFLTELRTQAETCNFQEKERMIRDNIVFSVTGKLRELLLRESQLDLKRAIEICRAYELTSKHVREMSSNQAQKIDKVMTQQSNRHKTRHQAQNENPENNERRTSREFPRIIKDCNFCGREHEAIKTKCPAWGKTCSSCKRRNHFKLKCKKVHQVRIENDPSSDDSDSMWLAAIQTNGKSRVTALMQVNGCDVRFTLDSAADVNTICQKFVKKDQVKPTTQKLIMWNESRLTPIGQVTLKVTNPKTGEDADVEFTVVKNGLACLLGVKTVQEMGLLTINTEKFIAQLSSDPIDPPGNLGEATLHVDPNVKPRTLPCRKLPFALQDDVKHELERLVKRGVLVPVDEPTPWVSQMAVVRKPNGSLRICIDPQPLNEALMREHYKLPVLDDVLPDLKDAKLFSKLDVKEAFWHVRLDKESSELTTMITPFGRFRWACLPFGLKVSSEIFQKRLNEALSDLKGVVCIADDIVVAGCGRTTEVADHDHDLKFSKLQERCSQREIKLNKEKAVLKQTQITFMGHLITNKGIQADQRKVEAIINMPAPVDTHGVKRLCGMIQYLSKFLPNLATDIEPIRALTRQGVEWNWSKDCEEAFKQIKTKLTEAPVLAYFDQSKELVVQVDSSKDGLGAALLQDGKPIEYASRSLTTSERRWAQIEKEALAAVFGLERFNQYTYGRKVVIQNDHKPLASIVRKPLSQAPRRLQALMLRLHRYDIDFQYHPGDRLFIADTLSRAYLNVPESEVRVLKVNAFNEVPDKILQEVQEATRNDNSMKLLMETIQEGWPDEKANVPPEIKQYFDFRETLSHKDGVILKGQRILVPVSLRSKMMKRLHAAHSGYDSMMRRAREAIFWPGMSQQVKQLAENCDVCQEFKPQNQRETLKQHEDGQVPWDKVAADLFEIKGRSYLTTVDYYSNFIEVDSMTTTTTSQVITKLKGHFSRYGIPRKFVSDNGPQFASDEFKIFTEHWGIEHVTSSPGHPQANGKAEAAVKIIKGMMKKALSDGTDQYQALLELRNTPRQDFDLSPAQMMFGRQTRSLIPSLKAVRPKGRNVDFQKRAKRRATVKTHHDKSARDLDQLTANQPVYFQHSEGENWRKGEVQRQHGDRSYILKGNNGRLYRRNRVHVRPATSNEGSQLQTNPNTESAPETLTGSTSPSPPPEVQVDIQSRPQRSRRAPDYLKDYILN